MGLILLVVGLVALQIVIFVVVTKFKANTEAKAFAKYTTLGGRK